MSSVRPISLFFVACSIATSIHAASPPEGLAWTSTLTTGSSPFFRYCTADDRGNVFAAGLTGTPGGSGVVAAALRSSDGTILWKRKFAEKGTNADLAGLTLAENGDPVLLLGWNPVSGENRIRTIRLSKKSGKIIWNRYAPGTPANSPQSVTAPRSLVVIAGTRTTGTTTAMLAEAYRFKDGKPVWTRTFSGSKGADSSGKIVFADSEDAVYFAGILSGTGSARDSAIARLTAPSASGTWFVRTLASNFTPRSLATLPDGNIALAGDVLIGGTGSDVQTIIRSASSGALVWSKTLSIGGTTADFANHITANSGGVYVAGQSNAAGKFLPTSFVQKYSLSGVAQWTNTDVLSGVEYSFPKGILADSGTTVILGEKVIFNSFVQASAVRFLRQDTGAAIEHRLLDFSPDESGLEGFAADPAFNVYFATGRLDGAIVSKIVPPVAPDLAAAKSKGAKLRGSGTYGQPSRKQILQFKIPRGTTEAIPLQLTNDGSRSDTLLLSGPPDSSGFHFRYFQNGTDVTAQVTGAGLPVTLAPSSSSPDRADIELQVTNASATGFSALSMEIILASASDLARTDTALLIFSLK